MKMKEREARERFYSLSGLGSLKVPSQLSFAISYNLEKFQREDKRIEKERKKLCDQYADKNEDGTPVMVDSVINGQKIQEYKMSDENRKAFEEEFKELLETEVDIEIRTVKEEVIERCEQIDRYDILSVSQLFALSFMLTK